MADKTGYIGRNPGDSSVIVARQTFESSGVQTNFTFASGYTPGYLDAYLNGIRLVNAQDYTATSGSVVGLTSAAQNGDVLELVAYKAFNLGSINNATGNFDVGGELSVTGVSTFTGDLYVGGDLYVADDVVYDEVTGRNINISGIGTFGGDVTFTGASYNVLWDSSQNSLEYSDEAKSSFGSNKDLMIYHTQDLSGQDDSNGDSVLDGNNWCSYIKEDGTGGLVFKSNGAHSTGAYQFYDTGWRPILRLYSGTSSRATLYYGGSEKLATTVSGVNITGIAAADNANITGVCTATSFSGDGAALTGLNVPAGWNELDAALFN